MNAVAIQYIWQAILESERSDDIQFADDELRIKAEATRSALTWPDQPGTLSGEPIAAAIDEIRIKPGNQATPVLDGLF